MGYLKPIILVYFEWFRRRLSILSTGHLLSLSRWIIRRDAREGTVNSSRLWAYCCTCLLDSLFELTMKYLHYPKTNRGERIPYLLQAFSFMVWQTVFIHDPTSSDSFWSFPGVENKGFLQSNRPKIFTSDHPISPGSFPITRGCDTIRPISITILSISWNIKVPFLLPYSCQGWDSQYKYLTSILV